TDIDPILFRVVTAVLVVVGGAGLILYGAAMLFIPDARSGRAPIDHVIPRSTQRNVGAATVMLAIVCGLVVIGGFTGVFGGGSISLVVLAVLALLVANRRGVDLRHVVRGSADPQRQARPGPQVPGTPAAQAFAAHASRLPAPPSADEQPTEYVDLATSGDGPPSARAARTARAPSITWLVWLAAVGVGVGVYVLRERYGGSADVRVPLAAALATLGAGLLASAWIGRARVNGWGVLLTLALGATTVLAGPYERVDFGPVAWAPTSAAALAAQQPYRQSVGQARLDLTRFPASSGTTYDATVQMTAGQLTVLVPKSAAVHVSLRCGGCNGTVLGDKVGGDNGGGGVVLDRSYPSGAANAPVVDLTLRLTAGNVEVRRVA
ncbi:MAG: hypothetical protein J2P14_05665, partial [Acidothermales bacterium]|nr:hypothetical protein [Acidothermales bacterium]